MRRMKLQYHLLWSHQDDTLWGCLQVFPTIYRNICEGYKMLIMSNKSSLQEITALGCCTKIYQPHRLEWRHKQTNNVPNIIWGQWLRLFTYNLIGNLQLPYAALLNWLPGIINYGPHRILECIGTVAYKLELLASSRIQPVFHVSCLKVVNSDVQSTNLPVYIDMGLVDLIPDAILDRWL